MVSDNYWTFELSIVSFNQVKQDLKSIHVTKLVDETQLEAILQHFVFIAKLALIVNTLSKLPKELVCSITHAKAFVKHVKDFIAAAAYSCIKVDRKQIWVELSILALLCILREVLYPDQA